MDQPACPTCGYDPSGLTPPDAAVAVRSFPRRFRELLDAAEKKEEGLAARPGADGWSAADHAAAAADALDGVTGVLRKVAVSDDLVLHPPAIDGAPSGAGVGTALAAVDAASRKLASVIDSVKGRDWEREGHDEQGGTWSALDVARLGVHAGVHHLRAAETTLGALGA